MGKAMKASINGRLVKLEQKTRSAGPHTLTIKYAEDYEDPPRPPVVMEAPDLKEDTVITIKYVKDWRQ